MSTREEILAAARSLPPPELALLLKELTASLEEYDVNPRDAEAAWSREIRRRHQEILAGNAPLIELEDVHQRIAARFGWK